MSGTSCAVADCRNIGFSGSPFSFHRFPLEAGARKAWIVKCKRGDKFNPSTARICSEHFKSEDYERDRINEVLGLPTRKVLKKGSVPSIFPNRGKENNIPDNSRKSRVLKRQNQKEVSFLTSTNHDEFDQCQPLAQPCSDFSSQVNFPNDKKNEEILKLKKRISELQLKVKNLRNRLRVERINKSKTHGRNKTFSSAQIKKLRGQRRVNWETADIVKALSLRSVSLKAYETARSTWNLPLPAPSTLRAWVYRFQCAPGIQSDIIGILGEHAKSFGKLTCLCSLTFDEMSLDGRYVMDSVNDQISSHSKVQVVMVRGLIEDWKQPIFFGFDVAMTDDLLKNIISQLESSQLRVVSITSDLGGENRGLWKFHNISPEKPWFVNPLTQKEKYSYLLTCLTSSNLSEII